MTRPERPGSIPDMNTLESLRLTNSYAELPEVFYTRVEPEPLRDAHLAAFNPAVAELLGLDPREAERPEFVRRFGGEALPEGADPIACVYAGHQFGHYVPQLGDGRAILLGEAENAVGGRFEVQLKGAGLTAYSRRGDGRAVLRSSIREYLCSEAMHGLGIPTTRALCLFGSREPVQRERIETGALLVRVAPSHVRFGSFEFFYYRGLGEHLRTLADHFIAGHYPELAGEAEPYLALYREVTHRTARLIAQWQLVGFAHGVMNTDNMSMLGLTLDFGPFGFMDAYDPGYICNSSDHTGRYAFDRQPSIGLWNISCLGQALLPLLDEEPEAAAEKARAVLSEYEPAFQRAWTDGVRGKLGLQEARSEDGKLASRLLDLLAEGRADYTNSFRALASFDETPAANAALKALFGSPSAFDRWAEDYRARLAAEGTPADERRILMNRNNPKYVLRNYLAQKAIEMAEQGDYGEIDRLRNLLGKPFDEQPGMEAYAAEPPDWGRGLALSCSS